MDYQEIKVQDVDNIQTKQQLFNLPDNKTP